MDEEGGNSAVITDYEQLKILASRGNRSAILLLETIEEELEKRKSLLEEECKESYPDATPPQIQFFVNARLPALRESVTKQCLAETPVLQKQVNTEKEKAAAKLNKKPKSELKQKMEEKGHSKSSKDVAKSKSDNLMQTHSVFKDLAKFAPVAETLIETFNKEDSGISDLTEKADTLSKSNVGTLLFSIIQKIMKSPTNQVRNLLVALVEMHPEAIDLLDSSQKKELGNMLVTYVKYPTNLIDPAVIKRANIKNCADLIAEFNRVSDIKFEQLSPAEQQAWCIYATGQEFISSSTKSQNSTMRKEVLHNNFQEDPLVLDIPQDINETFAEDQMAEENFLVSLHNQQVRIQILNKTPIQELSAEEQTIVNEKKIVLREIMKQELSESGTDIPKLPFEEVAPNSIKELPNCPILSDDTYNKEI